VSRGYGVACGEEGKGRSLGRGHCPFPEMFDGLMSKWHIFVQSLVLTFVFLYHITKNSENASRMHGLPWNLMEIDLDAIQSVI